MPDFDLERLIALLEDPLARVSLVVLRIEEEATDEQGAQASARYLTLDDSLRTRFRNGLRRALLPLRSSPPVPYEYGWVNLDDSVAEAEEAILEGSILTTVREAIGGNVERDFAPPPVPQNGDEAAAQDLVVGAYVAVVRRDGFPTALFFRRRDPVERLSQQRFSGIFDGGRLTKADRIFIFDSTYDVAAFDGRVLVRNAAAYEALFSNVVIRRQGARTAVTTLLGRMPVANLADLDHVIETDTRFAGRLRSIDRRGQLANLDPDAVRRTTARFRIDHRMIRGDELVFVPAWRWQWLSILEDSLLESPGTQALYSARIKSEWRRYQVTCVVRDERGAVAELGGDFGRVAAPIAMRQLRNGSATYFLEVGEGLAELDIAEEEGVRYLVARIGDRDDDQLARMTSCANEPQET